jgi:hypothetical protein
MAAKKVGQLVVDWVVYLAGMTELKKAEPMGGC